MKNKDLMRHVITVFVISIFVLLAIGSINNDPDAWKTDDNSSMAFLQMNEFVKGKLKAPTSAKFPSMLTDTGVVVRKDGEQTYLIMSYVDSKNSFGVVVRTKFVGRIQQISADSWKVLKFEITNN